MPPVVFTRQAREDLIEIWTHIAQDDAEAADRVLDRLDEAADHLARNPRIDAAREDIRPGLRHLVSGSYLLLYRISDDGIEIVPCTGGAISMACSDFTPRRSCRAHASRWPWRRSRAGT